MNTLFMPGEGRALPNETNRCFINCVLQIILHSKELFSLIKEIYTDSEVLISEYYTENKISVGEQCDSALFLNFVLDKINKLFNNGINPYYTIAVLSRMQCGNKHYTRKRQNENIMYIYVQSESNIIELFDSHMITDIEDYKCETCKNENMPQSETTTCRKYGMIESRPRNMFISVQNPNNTRIEIEKDFDFYTEPYVLKGFIKHIGSTQNWGHYVVYILDESGWMIYSDQRITPVSYETVKKLLQKGTSSFERISLLWYIPKVFAPKSYWICQSIIGNPSPFDAGDLTDTDSDSDSEIDLENLDKYINDPKFETRAGYPDPDPNIVSSLDEDISNDISFD